MSLLFEDKLDGKAVAGWRVPPQLFVDHPDHGRVYFLDWADRARQWPSVGSEEWSAYEISIEILPLRKNKRFGIDFKEGFLGLNFHSRDDGSGACNIHFPIGGSGLNEAIQSMGIWNNQCAWKLYPEALAYDIFPEGEWQHLRARIWPEYAELYTMPTDIPTLIFRDLPFSCGGIQFWSFHGSGFFRNLRVSSLEAECYGNNRDNPWRRYRRDEILCDWKIAVVARDNATENTENFPDFLRSPDIAWISQSADSRNIVNLSPLAGKAPNLKSVFAKAIIPSRRKCLRKCWLTYTDHMKVWCNGQLVFDGVARVWNSRHREKYFGGRLVPDEFEIDLSLESGQNELIVLSEKIESWGWGYWFRLSPNSPAHQSDFP